MAQRKRNSVRSQSVAHAHLVRGEEAIAACAALRSQTSPALGFAGLLIEFANAHFFLDPAPLHQFAEAADGLLGRFAISQRQFNHIDSCHLVKVLFRRLTAGHDAAHIDLAMPHTGRNPTF